MKEGTTPLLSKFREMPEFRRAIEQNDRRYAELQQMSLYTDLGKIEKLRTFEKLQLSTNGDQIYCFYGMFLPRLKVHQEKVFLTLIKRLEEDFLTFKGNYSILFFNSQCEGYDAFMGFMNMVNQFPEKLFGKLSRILVVHPQKSIAPVQWFSFGVVNKLISKMTVKIRKLEDLRNYDLDLTRLLIALPKEIISFDTKAFGFQEDFTPPVKSTISNASKDTKDSKEPILKNLHEYETDKTGVPTHLKTLISYFEQKPEKLRTEGIFRKNGSVDDISLLSRQIAKKNYEYVFLMEDPHPICSLIKQFFSGLKDPLFTNLHYNEVLHSNVDDHHKIALRILQQIPILHYTTLAYLLGFLLYRVIAQQKSNNMSIYNLAVVLTPCLFRPETVSSIDIAYSSKFVSLLMKVMSGYRRYFSSHQSSDCVYREEAQACIREVKKLVSTKGKVSMIYNLQSRIPSKPRRIDFYGEGQ